MAEKCYSPTIIRELNMMENLEHQTLNNLHIDKRICLIAGDGSLPFKLCEEAKRKGVEVTVVSLTPVNRNELKSVSHKVFAAGAGEVEKILAFVKAEGLKQLVFIGKVHKGVLFRNLKLDKTAISILKQASKLNDDKIMLMAIDFLAGHGVEVIDQSIFIQDLLPEKGVIGKHSPTDEQMKDIDYGFQIAKEMGRLDIGQSVVVQNKMILAIEAIEGTDRAIERGSKLGNGKAVVVKVSKPNQDKRFDIPAVGMQTIKTMKKFGATVLAVEAGATFIVEREEMIKFADKNGMVFIAV